MAKIKIDFEKVIGKIKPFHGINNAPIMGCSTKLYHYLGDAGIPYSRLHDTGGFLGGGRFVDIENIFKDFDADPEEPNSYDFAFTDWLLEQITKEGTEPFFRLGATIENNHNIKAYHIFPPKDNLKWAKICEGIIKHYNYGWANGYHYDIKYWEIWNEPDNEPEIKDNPMWKGTKEQYFELYKVTSNYLKEKFPEIKIGGYGSCGFYALRGDFAASANSSPRTEYFIEFFDEFFDYITSEEHKAPIDFFTWHSYAEREKTYHWCQYVQDKLDKCGLFETEHILNEWNPGIERRGTEADAAYILDVILSFHETSLSMLTYYDGQVYGSYQGLFDPLKYDILPAYYALHSFNELYKLKNEVYTEKSEMGFPLVAACEGNMGKILIANKEKEPMEIDLQLLNGWKINKLRVIDGLNGLVETEFDGGEKVIIPPAKIAMLECSK